MALVTETKAKCDFCGKVDQVLVSPSPMPHTPMTPHVAYKDTHYCRLHKNLARIITVLDHGIRPIFEPIARAW